jgi:hypothetical protein
MTLEKYLKSDAFLRFQDETLRYNACKAVERFLKNHEGIKKAQLYSLFTTIQAGGYGELSRLIEKQKEKNFSTKIKEFWLFLYDQVVSSTGPDEGLREVLRRELDKNGFLENENGDLSKAERNRIKKQNKQAIEAGLKAVLSVYFEHFNCHYFYKMAVGQGGNG